MTEVVQGPLFINVAILMNSLVISQKHVCQPAMLIPGEPIMRVNYILSTGKSRTGKLQTFLFSGPKYILMKLEVQAGLQFVFYHPPCKAFRGENAVSW